MTRFHAIPVFVFVVVLQSVWNVTGFSGSSSMMTSSSTTWQKYVAVPSSKVTLLRRKSDRMSSATGINFQSKFADERMRAMKLDMSNTGESDKSDSSSLDRVLSTLTNMFPLFVLGSAILGTQAPNTLLWVAKGNLVTIFLASVMAGTGMSLTPDDFREILQSKKSASVIPVGVLCQYGIMPLSALLVSKAIILNTSSTGVIGGEAASALFLGLTLVGCSPGGTASNLVSLIAGADVALSVLLTSCSTILAALLTPLLVKLIVSGTSVNINGLTLCAATAKVVLGPVALGMFLNEKAPNLSRKLSRFTPFASVVLVALICGGVVAQNAASGLLSNGLDSLAKRLVISVLSLHSLGFLAGYLIPKFFMKYPVKTCRTISIETGMQNSALAVVLARSVGADPLASLPGALSATVHSCIGSMLAAIWRFRDSRSD